MKLRVFTILLPLVIILPLFTACNSSNIEERLDYVEESVEDRLDAAEDAIENRYENDNKTTNPTTVSQNSISTSSSVSQNTTTTAITEEEATAIALEHAGFTPDQVNYLRTDYEIDDGIPQYEVEFHQDRFEYDYTINAETGAILSFSKDD